MATKAQLAAQKAKEAKAAKKSAEPATLAAPAGIQESNVVGGIPAVAAGAVNMATLAIVAAATASAGFTYMNEADLKSMEAAGYVEVNREAAGPDANGQPGVAVRISQAGTAALEAGAGTAAAPVAASPFTAAGGVAAAPHAPNEAVAPLVNTDAIPPEGTVATFAPVNSPAPAAPGAVGGFKIVANVPIPAARRFGKSSTYPFDGLQVGQAFFVAATTERPNPSKSMASTVNSATARYAVEDGTNPDGSVKFKNTRKFVLRRVTDGKDFGFPGVEGAGVWRTL